MLSRVSFELTPFRVMNLLVATTLGSYGKNGMPASLCDLFVIDSAHKAVSYFFTNDASFLPFDTLALFQFLSKTIYSTVFPSGVFEFDLVACYRVAHNSAVCQVKS